MKRFLFLAATFLAFTAAGCVTYQTPPVRYGAPAPGYVGPPQAAIVVEPSYLVFIPGLQVYFVPDISADIFFYGGRWYNRLGARWYWGASYRGPWNFIEGGRVPRKLWELPPGYRKGHDDYERVPYDRWEKKHMKKRGKRKHHGDDDDNRYDN